MKKILILLLCLLLTASITGCGTQSIKPIDTIEGNMKTYSEMSDGTWQCDGHIYKYRLEISGRLSNAVKDSTYIYLSNIEDITFEQAWKASGLSSNMDDYFDIDEAVLVELPDWQLLVYPIENKNRLEKDMASSKEYLTFILEQLSDLEGISYRAMMGEYIIYYREKIVGGIYDDRLLVKPVKSAVSLMPNAIYELPYDGAKEMLLVDNVDNKDFLTRLFVAMYDELPAQKKKKS